mgnify:CR=1 FL=1
MRVTGIEAFPAAEIESLGYGAIWIPEAVNREAMEVLGLPAHARVSEIPDEVARVVSLLAQWRVAMVPQGAVDERGLRPYVIRLRKGKIEKVEVTLGLRDAAAETVEITGGLASGDTLLLGAARGISPGTPVKVSAPGDVKK